MYKVIIVDDEKPIRTGLITYVDWAKLDFCVAGEASNGIDAFKLIKELKPHVVLTDIKMPRCTGIELMEKIKADDIDVRIVVLSGYDEFEYAKAALKAGAVDYLLKPIEFDKLDEVFIKIKDEFDKRNLQNIRSNKALGLLRDQFFSDLANGAVQKDEIVAKAQELSIEFNCPYYYVVIIELDDFENIKASKGRQEIDLYKFAIKNISEELCFVSGEGYTFSNLESEVAIIVGTNTSGISMISELKKAIDSTWGLSTTISVGEVSEGIPGIENSYKSAKNLLKQKFKLGRNSIISNDSTLGKSDEITIMDDNPDNKLILLIQQHDMAGINGLINATFGKLNGKAEVYGCYISFIKIINKFLETNGIRPAEIISKKSLDFDRIINRETVQDVISELLEVFTNVVEYLESNDIKYTRRVIEQVKKLINESYSSNISLEIAAQKVHMNPMYLSRIFKKETGMSYTDYLTDVRMEKAKKLMSDVGIKLYEISEMVGYYSPKHFSKVFKKATGITPKEFRNSVLTYTDKRS